MSRTLGLAFLAGAWLLGTAAAAGYRRRDRRRQWQPSASSGAITFAYRPGAPDARSSSSLSGLVILTATWRYEATVPLAAADSIARLNDGDAVRFRAVVDDEPRAPTASRQYRLDVREALVDGRWETSAATS